MTDPKPVEHCICGHAQHDGACSDANCACEHYRPAPSDDKRGGW